MTDVNPVQRLRSMRADSGAAVELADLLARVGSGEADAFERFYDATIAMTYGIAVRVVRDPAMAEEVIQEVYVELWRLAPRYDRARGSARSWAATIAHRRAVDRVRSEEARRVREEKVDRASIDPYDTVVEEVADRLERSRVTRALDTLSEPQREAVTLAYFGGHTYREVATLLEVPEGTVKTRIRDGLIKLRDAFGVSA